MNIILGYLLVVNIASFFLYGIDKYKAKKGKWRISEATLLMMAVIGGSIGAWARYATLASQDDAQEIQVWHSRNNHLTGRLGGLSANTY